MADKFNIYTPFFPYGSEQVQWQVDLQKSFPTVILYPYSALQVSKSLEMVFVLFGDLNQIDQEARETIVRHCSAYGRGNAERAVPSVEELRQMYCEAAKNFTLAQRT